MTKVAFIIEYFPPFAQGGAEWSTYYLAKDFLKKKIDCVVITPNLGAKSREIIEGVQVKRFPFYLKAKEDKLPGNFSYTNPLWIIWSAFFLYLYIKRENIDIIHIQGKYSIPGVILANIFLKKPTVTTVRDYIVICNYGLCLIKKSKACDLKEFFFYDFKKYYQHYVESKNPLSFIMNLSFALWGRLSKNMLKYFVNRVDQITVLSPKTREILQTNGITPPVIIIKNTTAVKINIRKFKIKEEILFVGRLTFGKGVNLLLGSIKKIKNKYPTYKFLFAGRGLESGKIKKMAGFGKSIILLGQLSPKDLLKYYRKAKLTVIPSLWPDPLPRVLIESLSQGTPVIVTNSGGLPDVVEDGVWGYVAKKNIRSLAALIEKGIKNNTQLRENIKRDFLKIEKKFGSEVIEQYKQLYKRILT